MRRDSALNRPKQNRLICFLRRNHCVVGGRAPQHGPQTSSVSLLRQRAVSWLPTRQPSNGGRGPPPLQQPKTAARGKWRLRLSYTASTKNTVRVQSPWFDTREEAEATASWWRLSWEQGNNGERINPHTHIQIKSQPRLLPIFLQAS